MWCEVLSDWALNQMLFNKFIFMQVLTYDKIESTNASERLECHDLPVLC